MDWEIEKSLRCREGARGGDFPPFWGNNMTEKSLPSVANGQSTFPPLAMGRNVQRRCPGPLLCQSTCGADDDSARAGTSGQRKNTSKRSLRRIEGRDRQDDRPHGNGAQTPWHCRCVVLSRTCPHRENDGSISVTRHDQFRVARVHWSHRRSSRNRS